MAILQAFCSILCTYTVFIWVCLNTVLRFLFTLVLFFKKCVGEVLLELSEVGFEHDLLSCLKEGRMNGLCTALGMLKYPILPN